MKCLLGAEQPREAPRLAAEDELYYSKSRGYSMGPSIIIEAYVFY